MLFKPNNNTGAAVEVISAHVTGKHMHSVFQIAHKDSYKQVKEQHT